MKCAQRVFALECEPYLVQRGGYAMLWDWIGARSCQPRGVLSHSQLKHTSLLSPIYKSARLRHTGGTAGADTMLMKRYAMDAVSILPLLQKVATALLNTLSTCFKNLEMMASSLTSQHIVSHLNLRLYKLRKKVLNSTFLCHWIGSLIFCILKIFNSPENVDIVHL